MALIGTGFEKAATSVAGFASFCNIHHFKAECFVMVDEKVECWLVQKTGSRQQITGFLRDFDRNPCRFGHARLFHGRRRRNTEQLHTGDGLKGSLLGNHLFSSISTDQNEAPTNEEEEKIPELNDKNVEPYLAPRKKNSNAFHSGKKSRRNNEASRPHKQMGLLMKELQDLKHSAKNKQHTIDALKRALEDTQEDLIQTKAELLKKDEALSQASSELKIQESRLNSSNELVLQQSLGIDRLRDCLKEVETVREDSEQKQELSKREEPANHDVSLWEEQKQESSKWEEPANHDISLLTTQNVIAELQSLVIGLKESKAGLEQKLGQSNGLLMSCQQDLEISKKYIVELERKLDEHSLLLKRYSEELALQRSVVETKELNLKEAREALETDRERNRLAMVSLDKLECELAEQKHVAEELALPLTSEKALLSKSIVELSSANLELQKRESALSCAQSELRLMEAELLAITLEHERIKFDFSSVKLVLDERECSLHAAQMATEEMRAEMVHLAAESKQKELKYAKFATILKEKEKQLEDVSLKLEKYKLQLAEATSVVERIFKLSQALIASPEGGNTFELLKDTILMQTNCELFAANRALLESELYDNRPKENALAVDTLPEEIEKEVEALKLSIFKKDIDLKNMHKAYIEKEQELKRVLQRWELREKELSNLQNVTIAEAKHVLSRLMHNEDAGRSKLAPDNGHTLT